MALAAAGAPAAGEPPAAPEPSPIADGPVPDAKDTAPGYQPVGPSERRGRTTPLDETVEPGTPRPASGGGDPNDFSGDTIDLDDLCPPPGPTREPKDLVQVRIPGPVKLRRLPSEAPPPDAPLLVRLCDADETRTFAKRELKDAVRAYKRARRGEYPRGRDKWLVVTRRDIAVRRADRAEAEWTAMLAEASTAHVDFDPAECP
jgi:hypothetical protein